MIKIGLSDATIVIGGDEKELKMIQKSQTYDDNSACYGKGGFDIRKLKHVPLLKEIKGKLIGFAGLAKEVIMFCITNKIQIENIEDKRTHFDYQKKEYTHDELRKYFNPNFKYVEHQIRALEAMIKTNKGLVVAPTSAGKCCEGNTKLIIKGGYKPLKIKKLFKEVPEEKYADISSIGLEVLTEQGYKKVEAIYKTNKRKLIKLVLKNGYKIEAVPEHRVLTNNGWKLLKDLTFEDKILCKKKSKKKKNLLKNILATLNILEIKFVEGIIKILSK